jgi:hypothetical protein
VSNTDHTETPGVNWGKQFLLLIRHPPCYSYIQSCHGVWFLKHNLWPSVIYWRFNHWSVLLTFLVFLCCPIKCLYVMSTVLWCTLRFPQKKWCSIRLYLQLFVWWLLSYSCYLCLLAHSSYLNCLGNVNFRIKAQTGYAFICFHIIVTNNWINWKREVFFLIFPLNDWTWVRKYLINISLSR